MILSQSLVLHFHEHVFLDSLIGVITKFASNTGIIKGIKS